MTDAYVVNRFFETPLISAPAPQVGEVATSGTALRDHPAVQQLAAAGLDLIGRQTQDIGARDGDRYRWAWNATAVQPGAHDGQGAFWSLLHAAAATDVLFADPRLPMILMEDANLRFREGPGAPPWLHEEHVTLTPGRLLMFPGWLRHTVCGPVIRIDFWALLPAEQA
jgi:hypothetical protein